MNEPMGGQESKLKVQKPIVPVKKPPVRRSRTPTNSQSQKAILTFDNQQKSQLIQMKLKYKQFGFIEEFLREERQPLVFIVQDFSTLTTSPE